MSEFPYTDEQVEQLFEALEGRYSRSVVKDIVAAAVAAGVTFDFPEPVFYVELQGTTPQGEVWNVCDRMSCHGPVAEFVGGNSEKYAREHAARLNREDVR